MVFNLLSSTPSVRSMGEILFHIKAVFLSSWHLVNVRTMGILTSKQIIVAKTTTKRRSE